MSGRKFGESHDSCVPVLPAYADETMAVLKSKRPKKIALIGGLGTIDYDRRTAICKAAGLL